MAKDYSKYAIEGVVENLGKSKLALAIIEDYVSKNQVDFAVLNAAFPDECQGGIHGVFRKKVDVKDAKRYYMDKPISLVDGTEIVVTNQWGIDNIPGLIERANKLGYKINHSKIEIKEVINENNIDYRLQDVSINISGQIITYFFARIDSEFLSEFKNAVGEASRKQISTEEFLQSLLSLTLNNGIENLPDFKVNLNMEKFELLCPKLFEIVSAIENGDSGDHYWLYERIFMSEEEVNFFDDNASISIYVDDNEVTSEQSLLDFCGDLESVWMEDLDQNSLDFKMLNQFHDRNMEEFGFENIEDLSIEKNIEGIKFIDYYFTPPSLTELSEAENQIKIKHSNNVTFTFNFETNIFSFSKLLFLRFSNAEDFTDSSNNQIGSYLFYDNEMIKPEVNINYADEIILSYNPARKSLKFLLEG
jgi:hypothetical protein